MEQENLNETAWGRKLTGEQLLYEDRDLFQDLFRALLSVCLMLNRSRRIMDNPEKAELHADAERIIRRSERSYEELVGLFTDYMQSTFRDATVLEADPFGKWVGKLNDILDTFIQPLQKRYNRLLEKEGIEDIGEDMEQQIQQLAEEGSGNGLHLWMIGLLSYVELYATRDEATELLLDSLDDKGDLPKKLLQLDRVTDRLEKMREGLVIAMFDYAMTDYELETVQTEEQEEDIQSTLTERANEADLLCSEARKLLDKLNN